MVGIDSAVHFMNKQREPGWDENKLSKIYLCFVCFVNMRGCWLNRPPAFYKSTVFNFCVMIHDTPLTAPMITL